MYIHLGNDGYGVQGCMIVQRLVQGLCIHCYIKYNLRRFSSGIGSPLVG